MHFKKALIGAAAVLATGVGAQAADLPAAAPAQYVKVCDTYGAGFFYLPGSTTCLRVAGLLRTDYLSTQVFARSVDGQRLSITGRVAFDARSQTEYGTLRTFMQLSGTRSAGDGGAVALRQAYIQFAGLTVGRGGSIYDFFDFQTKNGYNEFIHTGLASDELVTTAYYQASLGNGVLVSLGVEERGYRETSAYPSGQTSPNFVASAVVEQAWGAVGMSGAIVHDRGTVESKWGYAVRGSGYVNLPVFAPGSRILVDGGYTEGALHYAGSNEQINSKLGFGASWTGRNLPAYGDFVESGGIQQTKAWFANASVRFVFSPQWRTNLGVAYTKVDAFGTNNDFTYVNAAANVWYTPVKDLNLGLEVFYGKLDLDNAIAAPKAEDRWGVAVRAERTF